MRCRTSGQVAGHETPSLSVTRALKDRGLDVCREDHGHRGPIVRPARDERPDAVVGIAPGVGPDPPAGRRVDVSIDVDPRDPARNRERRVAKRFRGVASRLLDCALERLAKTLVARPLLVICQVIRRTYVRYREGMGRTDPGGLARAGRCRCRRISQQVDEVAPERGGLHAHDAAARSRLYHERASPDGIELLVKAVEGQHALEVDLGLARTDVGHPFLLPRVPA